MSEKFLHFTPEKNDELTADDLALLNNVQTAVGQTESIDTRDINYARHPDAEDNLHPVAPPVLDAGVPPGPETAYPKKPPAEM